MKYIGVIVLIFTSLPLLGQPPEENLEMDCYLQSIRIEGETNVNEFYFEYRQIYDAESVLKQEGNSCDDDSSFIAFRIPVHSFNGSNPLMKEDFEELLKASVFPFIIVKVDKKTIRDITRYNVHPDLTMYLTLAGRTRFISGSYAWDNYKDNKIIISGSTSLHLSDFKLEPPQKMMGLLKVKDAIFIKFDIVLDLNA